MKNLRVIATALLALFIFSSAGDAWNISPHMVNGAITYEILQRDSPATIAKIRAILESIPGTLTIGAMT